MDALITTKEAKKNFYPTPPELAAELVSDIFWSQTLEVLEPSAGTGNLVSAIIKDISAGGNRVTINVDTIEIDPALRAILAANFSEEARNRLYTQKEKLRTAIHEKRRDRLEVSHNEEMELRDLENQLWALECVNMRIVHDDFQSFDSRKHYGLIVMNPPFDTGDAHLLKAIRMQKQHGGMIRCILNAETLRNPYTARRQMLVEQLTALNARITFKKHTFAHAERPTDVEIAIIKIDIPVPERKSEIYERLKKAAEEMEYKHEATELVANDPMQQAIMAFQIEVDAGCELIRNYLDLVPYIRKSQGSGHFPILELTVNGKRGTGASVNAYIREVRRKYWNTLFQNPDFVSGLTSNLREELYCRVEEMTHYDFSEYNIRTIMLEMRARLFEGVKETILDLFEKLTAAYTWFPDSSANIHYYNGWATNKAHKINNKVIIPANGVFSTYSWTDDAFNVQNLFNTLSDIEKVLNYLDSNITCPVNLEETLKEANRCKQTRKIQLKYFEISIFKKGTIHIKFNCPQLLERFNIYCSQNKNWLPPSYGQKKYADMTEEERMVIDGFHGTGEKGSGEDEYENIMAHANYYLAPPNTQTMLLKGE